MRVFFLLSSVFSLFQFHFPFFLILYFQASFSFFIFSFLFFSYHIFYFLNV